jgi:exosortase/archaeosortase family protein
VRSALRLGAALAWVGVIALAHAFRGNPLGLLETPAGLVASLTNATLNWLGLATQRTGTVLYLPGGFSYDVTIGCTGLLPVAVLAVGILASPGTAAAKRRGLAVGVPLLLAINLLRLVHLFWIGVKAPSYFDLAHSYLWEATLVVCTFVTWLLWSRWAAGTAQGEGDRLASPPRSCISG